MSDVLLTVDGLSAGYVPDLPILHDVSIAVARAAITVIIGPNGAGKSTLIKAIAGLVPVSSGRIAHDDQVITHVPAHEMSANGISYVPQNDNIFRSLTIRENLELALRNAGAPGRDREWLSLGGSQKLVMANALKSDDFLNGVGAQYLTEARGMDNAAPRVASSEAFVAAYTERFGEAPSGPGLPYSYEAAMIALLAMEAAGKDADGAAIAASVPRVTDPAGTPVSADTAGFAQASEVLSAGGTVMYQGGTGNVTFDKSGNVSAPAVVWAFGDDGIEELRYLSLEDVNNIITAAK